MITSKVTSSIIFTRLITGLIMMAYCFGHMINHSLGIISVEAMDFFRQYFMAFWRAPGIYWLMPISIVLHTGTALFTVSTPVELLNRTKSMPYLKWCMRNVIS